MNPEETLATLLLTPEGRADPYVHYGHLRASAPVFRSVGDLIVLSRYHDCAAALRNPRLGRGLVGRPARSATASGADPELRKTFFDRGGDSMLLTDPPQHGRLRRLVSRAFTPRRVAALRPAVTGLVDRLLDGLEGDVDMLKALAFPLPNHVIGQLVGVPEADRAGFEELVHTSSAGLEPTVDDATIQAAMAAQDVLQAYFTELLAERRRRPGTDLLSGAGRRLRGRRPPDRPRDHVDRDPAVRGRVRDHHQPDRQRAAGPVDPPQGDGAPPGRPVPCAQRGRGAAAVGQPGPAQPSHRPRGHGGGG